jgi:YidC/Oxa1 family membrane protein insertase
LDFRRILAFLAMSMALLALANWIFPPPPPQKPDQAAAPVAGQAVADGDDAPPPADDRPPAVEQPAADLLAADRADIPHEFVTLGSLDPASGYRMLVTATNQGAAIHRVELSSPRFWDLHDRSGYLGHLALENVAGGVKVHVVGAGTPADQAGIKVGDVIVGIGTGDANTVGTIDEFEAALAKLKPGREVTLRVVRDGGDPQPMAATLVRRPLEVMRPEIENIRMRNGAVPDGFVDPPSFLLSLASWNGKRLEDNAAAQLAEVLEDGNWAITLHDESSVTFERTLASHNIRLVKRYTLKAVPPASRENENYPGYDLQLDVEIHNTADAAQQVAYRLDGPTGLPMEAWWYGHKVSQRWFSMAGLRDVAVRFQGSSGLQIDCSKIADDKTEAMGQGRSLAYAGVDGLYFSSILIPRKASLDEVWFDTTEAIRVGARLDPRTPKTYTNVTCRLTRNSEEIEPGEVLRDSFQVFVGPKRPALLSQYQAAGDPNYSLSDLIYYGWFGAVARLMLGILHFFYGIVGNYGIAIVMLTIVVRGAMFPISFKQTKNMARMQALKPEMDRITEKYKSDLQKRSQAMNELYRKHSINPLGGCLPVFLQLPVFIGLYRSIMVDVELRQTPLFGHSIRWCSDLSAPDMLLDWSAIMPDFVNNGETMFSLGPYFNVLPLVTVAMFLISMKISMPPPTTDQAIMQQKIMKYMTIFMAVLFYKVASGLCLYFIASSIWGIGERKLLNFMKQSDEPGADAAASTQKKTDDAKASRRPSAGRNGSPSKKKGRQAKRRR